MFITEKRNSDKPKKIMPLDYVKCYWKKIKKKWGILFFKRRKSCTLFFTKEAVWEDWRRALRGKVLLDEFHDKFQVLNVLGSGAFATVILPPPTLITDRILLWNRPTLLRERKMKRNSWSRHSTRRTSSCRNRE